MTAFPSEFVWGVSTAAYQIEGAVADGKGASIWDTFAHEPGRIKDGTDGDEACQHLERMDQDLELLARLGVGAYRFSTAWTRLFPEGGGRLRRAGLDIYERLVDGLLERGIAPWLCLYHWDLPQALQDRGGWAYRDTVHYFVDYAGAVAEHLGDRVRHFLMLNEPNVHAVLGHLLGVHAPGVSDFGAFTGALHHQNLATGMGVSRLRDIDASFTLGTVVNLQPVVPAAEGEEHQQAAELFDAVWNRATLDPLLLGRYPDATAGLLGELADTDDLRRIHQPLDVLGVNFYSRAWVRASSTSLVGLEPVDPPEGSPTTAMGWEVAPEALTEVLADLRDAYGNPPVVISENGAAYDDVPDADGRVDDVPRARYLTQHLRATREAMEAGCDVRGYFAWTLVDNFEWAEGFSKRFGLVRLDRAHQSRTPKRSFDVYRSVVRGRPLAEVEAELPAAEG